jgi:hypothetical protein
MAMKQRSGTKSKTIERMLNVFQSSFSASEMKQCLEFALAKLGRICKYLADAYNSNSHVCGLHCLTFVCEKKQENQRNEASRLSENVLKRAQRYLT